MWHLVNKSEGGSDSFVRRNGRCTEVVSLALTASLYLEIYDTFWKSLQAAPGGHKTEGA